MVSVKWAWIAGRDGIAAADTAERGGIAERDGVVEWTWIAAVDTAEQNEIAE